MIKKTILMLLVLVGGVMSANAANRIFFEIQNSDWRNNSAGIMIHIWDAGADNTTWESIPYISRIGSTNWYYFDVQTSTTNAHFKLVTNSDKSWQSDNKEIDFSKNNVVYFVQHNNITINNFTGYVIANSARTKICDLSKNGMVLSGTLDLSEETNDVNFAVFPTFTANEGGTEKYIWDVALRPKTSNDFALNNFQIYSDDIEYKGNEKTWKDQLRMKYSVSIDMANGNFTMTPSFTRTISAVQSNGAYYATFSSGYTVGIPSDVTAFYAGSQSVTGTVSMTSFSNGIPAGEGAFLELTAASNNLTFTPPTSSADVISGNLLKPTGSYLYDATKNRYVFAKQGNNVGFFKITEDNYHPAAGKAYLEIPGNVTAPSLSIELDGETTGIKVINIDSENNQNNNQMYDLQGRRIAEPTKGVYIVNGKKVIIK